MTRVTVSNQTPFTKPRVKGDECSNHRPNNHRPLHHSPSRSNVVRSRPRTTAIPTSHDAVNTSVKSGESRSVRERDNSGFFTSFRDVSRARVVIVSL